MSSVITISELQNVEAVTMKYVAQNLGLNIRPLKAHFIEEKRRWRVPLQAIVPRRVTKRDQETKVFIYYLDDVGHLLYEKPDKTFELVSSPTYTEIEREITQRFSNLTEQIEREVLKEGETNWGKLSWIRNFLHPMYSIVINILSRKEMPIEALVKQNQWKYAKLLLLENYIKKDKERPEYLVATNKLTGIWERLYRRERTTSNAFTVAELVVGKVFANRYDAIKTDLRISPPAAYVDTTKVYYVEAIRFGENIAIREDEIFLKYHKIGARAFRPEIAPYRFRTLLSELVAAELLDREGNYVTGRQRIFDNLIKYRDEVLQGAVEAPRVAEVQ